MSKTHSRYLFCLLPSALCLLVSGCTRPQDGMQPQSIRMWNDSRLKPLEESPMPGEASSSRAIPVGAIARGERASGDPVMTGRGPTGALLTKVPFEVTTDVLSRGQERYNIYCAPCHSRLGDGRGMIVRRGFPHPPDYGLKRLKEAPVGHFYDVITRGYGVMYSYASRVQPNDRWAIAAYLRVLQSTRPTVTVDPYEEERIRARSTGIGTLPAPPQGPAGESTGAGHSATEPAPGPPGAVGTPAETPGRTNAPSSPGGSSTSPVPGPSGGPGNSGPGTPGGPGSAGTSAGSPR